MKNELMTVTSVAELANKDLKKNCNAILKELAKVNKSAWSIARFYSFIVNNEQWKEDFETFKDFADYVNVNRTTLLLYSKVAKLSIIIEDSETYKDIESVITVSKMIELLPLFKDKDWSNWDLIFAVFNDVIDEMGGFDVFVDMSNKEVREWVKFWIAEHDETKEVDETEEVDEKEEVEEVEELEEEKNGECVIEDYVLTADNLKDFENTILNLIKQGTKSFHVTVRL